MNGAATLPKTLIADVPVNVRQASLMLGDGGFDGESDHFEATGNDGTLIGGNVSTGRNYGSFLDFQKGGGSIFRVGFDGTVLLNGSPLSSLPPGVTGDGGTPGGLVIAGAFTAGDSHAASNNPSVHTLSGIVFIADTPDPGGSVLEIDQTANAVSHHNSNALSIHRGVQSTFHANQPVVVIQNDDDDGQPALVYFGPLLNNGFVFGTEGGLGLGGSNAPSDGGLATPGVITGMGGAVITGPGGATTALEVHQPTGATGLLANYYDHTGGQVAWIGGDGELVTNDDIIAFGHINCHAGFSAWNHAIPDTQPSITGALSTVTDTAAQDVLTSIIAILAGCGLALGATT